MRFADRSSKPYKYGRIAVYGENIIVEDGLKDCVRSQTSVLDIVLTEMKLFNNIIDIKKVIFHKNFKSLTPLLIENMLKIDQSGIPLLFKLPHRKALLFLKVASSSEIIDPLKIIDFKSGHNLFMHFISAKNCDYIKKITRLFPQSFQAIKKDFISALIQNGIEVAFIQDLVATEFQNVEEILPYYNLWLHIASGKKPDENFYTCFAALSSEHKELLYAAAYVYRNCFFFEPADNSVSANQYSINVMWINKEKITDDREFLFGKGWTSEVKKQDFYDNFITPVSELIKKNPGSLINIWVDGEFASKVVIERSEKALKDNLDGTSVDLVQFRDVRSIPLVNENWEVFSSLMPIYFRVDLLRAIAGDHTLKNKETQYFVYGDIDMEPLSGEELFDKKTLNFLEDYGFVMAKGGASGFENGFQILNGANSMFMKSHRKVIIDLSIDMANESPHKIKEQQIYDTYPAMVAHFLNKDKRYGEFKHLDTRRVNNLDFRYDQFIKLDIHHLPFEQETICLRDIMPTKPVRLPPSHF